MKDENAVLERKKRPMNKAANNSRWSQLSSEQVQTLETWLFEDNLTYEAAQARAKRELGFSGSVSSLRRFFLRRIRERTESRFSETIRSAENVLNAPGDVRRLRSGIMKIISQQLFRRVCQEPDAIKEWEPLVKLLLRSEQNELYRQLKGEENMIREGYLDLAIRNREFGTIADTLKYLPALNDYARRLKEPFKDKYDKNRIQNEIRKRLFGPGVWTAPESEAEELEKETRESIQRDAEHNAREHLQKTGEWIDPEVFARQDPRRAPIRYALPKVEHEHGFEI